MTDDPRAHILDAERAWQEQDDNVMIDPNRVVLLDAFRACLVAVNKEGKPGVAFQLQGRINNTDERVGMLHLSDLAGVASLCAQLIELVTHTGQETSKAFSKYLEDELHRFAEERTQAPGGPAAPVEVRRNDVRQDPS